MATLFNMVLAGIGAPETSVNSLALQYWADSEGTPASWNNPFATTWTGYGGVNVNSAGVKAYPTRTAGADATVATLRSGSYGPVITAFRHGTSLLDIYRAINGSPWCFQCQSGHYPVALYDYIQKGSTVTPAPAPKPASSSGNPRSGKQWDSLQAAWTFARRTMTQWPQGQRGLFATIEGKMRRVGRL